MGEIEEFHRVTTFQQLLEDEEMESKLEGCWLFTQSRQIGDAFDVLGLAEYWDEDSFHYQQMTSLGLICTEINVADVVDVISNLQARMKIRKPSMSEVIEAVNFFIENDAFDIREL